MAGENLIRIHFRPGEYQRVNAYPNVAITYSPWQALDQLRPSLDIAVVNTGRQYNIPPEPYGAVFDDVEGLHALTYEDGRVALRSGIEMPMLAYRGQTQEHLPCLPGLARLPHLEDQLLAMCRSVAFEDAIADHPYVRFSSQARFFDAPLRIDPAGMAQHYGLATDLLDVTSNYDVASFFATCEWNDAKLESPRNDGSLVSQGTQTYTSEREYHNMSLPLRKRTVHFYEIHVQARAKAGIQNPSCAPLPALLNCFAGLANRNKLPQTIRKSIHLHTVLADWKQDKSNNCYQLLISKANAALSDVALRDLSTKRLRMAGKTKVEGIEISAHILLRPNADGKTAAVLLTMGAGVAAKDIEVLLTGMSRLAAKRRNNKALYWFDDPSGAKDAKGKAMQYEVQYRFSAQAYMGQTLAAALQSGEFESMELIAPVCSQFDSGGNLQITERSLSVHAVLPKTVTGASIRNAISYFKKQPDGASYSKLRIHYKTVAGKNTSATLDLNNLDAAFTLKEQIELDTDVEAQQETLNPTIVQSMNLLLQSLPA